MKFYVAYCHKCKQHLWSETASAHNKKDAANQLQNKIKNHDLVHHGADGRWPDVEVLVVSAGKPTRKPHKT